jgi:hypothetical protein
MLDAHLTRGRAFSCWHSLLEEVLHSPILVGK